MKKSFAALVFGAVMAAAPAASADALDNLFRNTLVAQVSGAELRFHFNPDHTYVMTLPDGTTLPGAWTNENGQWCAGLQGAVPDCYPIESVERDVGDTWTMASGLGEVTYTLVAGR